MLRLLIDKLGSGHHDLFLKIDVRPDHVFIADSYFLSDFLELHENELSNLSDEEGAYSKYEATQLITYWIDRIKAIEKGQETFIIFDLSDQYIGGLLVEKVKRGFTLKYVYSSQIQGPSVNKEYLNQAISTNNIEFKKGLETEWLIGEEALFSGLSWSLNELT